MEFWSRTGEINLKFWDQLACVFSPANIVSYLFLFLDQLVCSNPGNAFFLSPTLTPLNLDQLACVFAVQPGGGQCCFYLRPPRRCQLYILKVVLP